MAPTPRLARPPREIPPGLRWAVLAHRDVSGSLLYFIPAAALAFFAIPFQPAPRGAMLLLAAILLALGLQATLASLRRSAHILRRMRDGFLVPGRIVAARFAWDSKSGAVPYDRMLSDWAEIMGKAQMNKVFGCLWPFVVLFFIVPFILAAVVFGVVLILGYLGDVPMPKGADSFILQWISGVLLMLALLVMGFRYTRRSSVKEVTRYMEWRKIAKPGDDDEYDEEAIRLVEEARLAGKDLSLKTPLPPEYGGLDLQCTVEYSMGPQRVTGTGRVRFTDRLQPQGVEALLFDPGRPGDVVFLAGLPEAARVGPRGEWQEVAVDSKVVAAAVSLLAGGVAASGIAIHIPWVVSLVR